MKDHIIYDSSKAEEYDTWFDDECGNLFKDLDHRILVIADLDLWNGHHSAYRILDRMNLNEIMYASCEDSLDYKVCVEGNDVVAYDGHHDGTNRYEFRLIKNEDNIHELTDKIYNGDFTEDDVEKYTTSLAKTVKDIYGWGKKNLKKVA